MWIFLSFLLIDRILVCCRIQGVYALMRGLHDLALAVCTFLAVCTRPAIPFSPYPLWISFTIYQILLYSRTEEDICYILQRILILPIGWYTNSSILQGYTLFFLSLPAGFDYFFLFSKRTYRIHHIQYITRWIRTPLEYLHHMITLFIMYNDVQFSATWWSGWIAMWMIYENGIYFEQQMKLHSA